MKSTLEFLYSLQKFGMKSGLRNIRRLLKSIGNPHTTIRAIHVAGTNGKGSTSSMIAAILTAAGYNVGLYTSPHLVKFNERIRINGKMISDKDIVHYVKLMNNEIQRTKSTFFETTTAMAFKYFADKKVDFAVIETGLGGRLDSTNIIHPIVSVITTIGKDHTEILGKTIQAIAIEKSGIIKRSIPVVVGAIKGMALNTILHSAREKKSPIIFSPKMNLPGGSNIQLKGKYQISNAKAAVSAIAVISHHYCIGDKAIIDGLRNTSQLTGLRGRFELIGHSPSVLLDVAHNPDGIKALVNEIKRLHYKKINVLFAAMKDKDYRLSLQLLKQLNPLIIATQPSIDRAVSSELLYSTCESLKMRCIVTSNIKDAVTIGFAQSGSDGLLVITGSHFLVGEVIPLLKPNKKKA